MNLLPIIIIAQILLGSYSCGAQPVTYKLYPSKEYHGRHKRNTITVVNEPTCRTACGHDYTCTKFFFGKEKLEEMSFVFRKTATQMIGISKDSPDKGCHESILFDLNDSINTVRLEAWNSPIGVYTKLYRKIVNNTSSEYSYSFGYMTPSTSDYLLYITFNKNFNIIGVAYSLRDFSERDGEVEFRPKKLP